MKGFPRRVIKVVVNAVAPELSLVFVYRLRQ